MLQNQLRFWLTKFNSSFQMIPNSQVLSNWTSCATVTLQSCEVLSSWLCHWSSRNTSYGMQPEMLPLLMSCPAVPNTVILWNPCLLTEFWNCPVRLILCRALPWGALIKLPISPAEDCNFPCEEETKNSCSKGNSWGKVKWSLDNVPW